MKTKRIALLIAILVVVAAAIVAICCTVIKNDENSSSNSSSGQQQSGGDSSNQEQNGNNDGQYVPADSILSFSNENANKVVTEATFDVDEYTNNAGTAITPYQIFSSGMCLQRDAINRIWGEATNAQHIAVEINGKVYYGTVSDGNFEIYLPMMHAGGPYDLTFITEAGRKTLINVYIGEVFLLSGQSNMEMQMQFCIDEIQDIYSTSACVNDQIRVLQVSRHTPVAPSDYVADFFVWKGANQSTLPNFTAVGYLFGKQMQEELGCPVGLISNPVAGSSIEFWLSQENCNKVKESYVPYTDETILLTPTLGYNGMLYPLTGINVRGVVWYQGESNAFGTQDYYDIALKIYMQQCREMFNNDKLAFILCELARYNERPLAYSVVNEKINEVAQSDPYAVVARNLDGGDWDDIHPKDKRNVAQRAAYETLRVFFNKQKAEPIKVTNYTFNDDGSVTVDLSANASLVNGNNGFEVSIDNGQYTYNCNVTAQGNQLTVTANGNITKVRYGYTCKMTQEIENDVSKTVTVLDSNGFPLDLFEIVKDPSMPSAPGLTAGYCDTGYEITVNNDGAFVINKSASAEIWTCAQLAVTDYSSDFTSLAIKLSTTNVTNLTVQFFISGVETGWQQYINLGTKTVTDGEHEINIDFSDVLAVDGSWNAVSGHYIKNYKIEAVLISLDTAVEGALINEDASCTIQEIAFKAE